MSGVLALAKAEFCIALRNRWVAIAAGLMALFALVLSAAGAAPSGGLGADRLSITVASLTSLAVYLVPLLALLMSFDAVAGEVERGTLPLLLSYPIGRGAILLGKLAAHLAVLALALTAGYGLALIAALAIDSNALEGLPALFRLGWTSLMLGATFLCAGYALSARARRPSSAAGLAIGLWLGLVVLYDLGLLAAVVADDGGVFTVQGFPVALLANPADAFRLFNLSMAQAAGAGVGGAAGAIAPWKALISILFWPVLAFGIATRNFKKVTV